MKLATLTMRAGRERSLQRRHPWVFSGAVASLDGDAAAGDVVRVVGHDRRFLAYAGYNPRSQIVGRVWSFHESDVVDAEFVAARVAAAHGRRAAREWHSDAQRLVFGESDGLPGLVVDRYGAIAVVQFNSAAAERFRDAIVAAVAALAGVESVYERSESDSRKKEGLARAQGLLWGAEPPELAEITEHGCRFMVDVRHGHKTGFYLDQRDNRAAVRALASGRRVLNICSYTGAFSVAAALGGAVAVRSIDSSRPALDLVEQHGRHNGVDLSDVVCADAFTYLRELRDAEESFDLIVLDPPKLANTQAQVARATRGYKDLNWLALRLLAPGGLLATFSCSGAIGAELFQKVVAGAALDAGRDTRIEGRFTQAADHPVLTAFPEADYLTGLLLRVD